MNCAPVIDMADVGRRQVLGGLTGLLGVGLLYQGYRCRKTPRNGPTPARGPPAQVTHTFPGRVEYIDDTNTVHNTNPDDDALSESFEKPWPEYARAFGRHAVESAVEAKVIRRLDVHLDEPDQLVVSIPEPTRDQMVVLLDHYVGTLCTESPAVSFEHVVAQAPASVSTTYRLQDARLVVKYDVSVRDRPRTRPSLATQ